MAQDTSALEQQLDAKYQEILEATASEMKLGKFGALPGTDQGRVESEAETAIDKWMEEAETSQRPPKTPLERLYADYAAIEAKFPDTGVEGEDEQQK
jgi:hypothetical protein